MMYRIHGIIGAVSSGLGIAAINLDVLDALTRIGLTVLLGAIALVNLLMAVRKYRKGK